MLILLLVFLFLLLIYFYLSTDIIFIEYSEPNEFANPEKRLDGSGMGSIDTDYIAVLASPSKMPTRSGINTESNGSVYANGDISTFLPSKVPFKAERVPLIEYGTEMFDPYGDNDASMYRVNHSTQVEIEKKNRLLSRNK